VTSRDDPNWPLQRNGHADIVETQEGELYLVHLCGRPLDKTRLCPLGRETAMQRLTKTDDGWYRLENGGHLPELEVDAPELALGEAVTDITNDDFDSTELNNIYQWLRTPYPEMFYSLRDNPGHLRIYGMESPGSLFNQALIARRQTDFAFRSTTVVDFNPENFQQLAGLICYYNSRKFHYLYISTDDQLGKHIGIMSCEANCGLSVTHPIQDQRISVPADGLVWLRATVDYAELVFCWSDDGENWQEIPVKLDQSLLSDEAGMSGAEQFTGAFIGLCCNDLTGARKHADFEFFSYEAI
jgi:xylan 1,4-beta-xylosidase